MVYPEETRVYLALLNSTGQWLTLVNLILLGLTKYKVKGDTNELYTILKEHYCWYFKYMCVCKLYWKSALSIGVTLHILRANPSAIWDCLHCKTSTTVHINTLNDLDVKIWLGLEDITSNTVNTL